MLVISLLWLSVNLQTTADVSARDMKEFKEFLVGDWNNQEQVAFQGELNQPQNDRRHIHFRLNEDGTLMMLSGKTVDDTTPVHQWSVMPGEEGNLILTVTDMNKDRSCRMHITRVGEVFTLSAHSRNCRLTQNLPTMVTNNMLKLGPMDTGDEFHRAQWFTCWVSRKKEGEGWTFTPNMRLHDQGGFVFAPEEEGVTRPAGIRMRNVKWPYGRNRDSLVLYVHDDPDKPAISYVWTASTSDRIAVNFRWVQASCTKEGS